MAYSIALLLTADVDNMLLDKPLLVGEGGQEKHSSVQWRPNGDNTGIDDSLATFPTYRARDRKATTRTRPTQALDPHYLNFFNTGSPLDFDCFGAIGLNWGTIGTTCEVQIADDAAWTVNVITVATITPAALDDGRWFVNRLNHLGTAAYYAYRNVEYLRLKFSGHGATRPEVGEAFFAVRRQMPHWPQNPWDPLHWHQSDYEVFSDDVGDGTVYKRASGFFEQPMEMKFATAASADYLRNFWADTDDGGRKGLLVARPNTAPRVFHLCSWPPPGLAPPETRNPTVTRYSLQIREAAPFYSDE